MASVVTLTNAVPPGREVIDVTTFAYRRLFGVCRWPSLLARIRAVPISSWKDGIGEIHPPGNRIDPYIVRPVEQFASIIVHQHDMASIRKDLPYFSMQVGTRDEVAIFVESHPVGAAGALQE